MARQKLNCRCLHRCIVWAALVIGAVFLFWVRPAFGSMTVSGSAADTVTFLEELTGQRVSLVKTVQNGRVKAVLYENEAGQLGLNVFERRLLGLRWKHDGMNLYDGDGQLYLSGSWNDGGIRGSRCDIVVCGDNRGGEVQTYSVPEAGIETVYVPVKYILDVYILDGIENLPRELQQETVG